MNRTAKLPIVGHPAGKIQIVAHALVDSDLLPELLKRSWSFSEAYPNSTLNGKTIRLHTMVCLLSGIDIPKGKEVDHRDRNPLNNRVSNLRIVTRTGNMANRGAQNNSASGYRGVSWSRGSKKWLVSVQKNRKRHRLGLFEDKHAAAGAVNAFFALHFPDVPAPNVIK